MPVSRPRAMLMVARSSGRPSRLLRRASVTNSSISLPCWRVVPRMMAPAACSGVRPLLANSSGLRKAATRPISLLAKLESRRSISSVSMEWPKRYTVWANSATMDGSMVPSNPLGARNASTKGCTLRANSSNTRCWYCISVPNLAAWNRRSPFHSRAAIPSGVVGTAPTGVSSHWLRKARSLDARTTSLVCSNRRLCSEWKTW
ncbi:hypothetical protein D9M68_306310 [compost metagenome]